LFDDAQQRWIPPRIGADTAQLALRQVEALPAWTNSLSDPSEGVRQCERMLPAGAQQIMREPFGRFRSNSRQLPELLNESGNRPGSVRSHG
jgi:hypothetical protein